MTPLEQEAIEDVLTAYALGELSPQEASALERRMASDPALAAESLRLKRTLRLLSYAAVEQQPPPGLRDRVLGSLAGAESSGARRVAGADRGRRAWGGVVAALAASVALAIGVDDHRVRRELSLLREVTRALQQPNVVLSFELRGTGAHGGAFGTAVLDLDAKRAALVARDLPALPSDRVYRLWALVGTKQVPCGDFNADAHGRVTRQFAIPVQEYTEPVRRLIVTVEPAAQASHELGSTVMVSS